jgi:hypothetical protein
MIDKRKMYEHADNDLDFGFLESYEGDPMFWDFRFSKNICERREGLKLVALPAKST